MAEKRKDPITKKNFRTGENVYKDGGYFFRKMINGKTYSIYAQTLMELRKKEDKLLKDLDDNIKIDKSKMTLNELMEKYIEANVRLRDTTKNNYIYIWDKDIKNDIGTRAIETIDKSDITAFYARLTKKGYKSGTLQLYQNLLFPAFQVAVDDYAIRRNPCNGAMKNFICDDRKEKIAMTLNEQRELLEFAKNSPIYNIYFPMLTVFLSTACRCGEVIGLTWKDVDMKKHIVDINHQLTYKKIDGETRFRVTKPKTKKGTRQIPMTNDCFIAFQQQKKNQFELGIDRNVEVDELKGFCFTTREGKPIQPNSINRFLVGLIKAYNNKEEKQAKQEKREPKFIPHISVHGLRHTGCTRMVESGMSVDVVQTIMGHENISTTLDIYNHVSKDKIASEIQKTEEFFKIG